MMNKISQKEDIDIRYVHLEEGKDQIHEVLQLLYDHLQTFISEDALKDDIIYCFEKGRVIGAYHEDELIGAVVGTYTPFFDKFHIGHIAVEEKFRGLGIGKKLTEKIIPDKSGVSVHLNIDNPGIEKFYKKMGFRQTHKRFKKPAKENSDAKPSD